MHRSLISSVSAACLALAASYAHADTVVISSFTFNPAITLNVGFPNYSGASGEFSGTLNGASFMTFCADLVQQVNFGAVYTDYSIVSGVTAFGAQKSADLDKLFSYFAATGTPSNAVQSAVAQAAVWEVLYDGAVHDFTSGTFSASTGDAATQTALNAFNWAAVSSTAVTVHADRLFSPTAQDFVVLTPVPEPSTYALMLAGLAGMGFVARRRAQR